MSLNFRPDFTDTDVFHLDGRQLSDSAAEAVMQFNDRAIKAILAGINESYDFHFAKHTWQFSADEVQPYKAGRNAFDQAAQVEKIKKIPAGHEADGIGCPARDLFSRSAPEMISQQNESLW